MREDELIPEEIRGLHPAVVGAGLFLGLIGSRELAATLVHLAATGFLSARVVPVEALGGPRTTTELHLHGLPAPKHRGARGPIRDGHVDGLRDIDRRLLSLLFDDVARGPVVTLHEIRAYRDENAVSYSRALTEWRQLVRRDAQHAGLLDPDGGRTREAHHIGRLRGRLREAIPREPLGVEQLLSLHSAEGRLRAYAVVFGMDRRLASHLHLPTPLHVDTSPSAGIPDSRRWLHNHWATRYMNGWRE